MAQQKVAVVTGAGTGSAGRVAGAGRTATVGWPAGRADSWTRPRRRPGNAKTISVPTDVSDPESIKALFARPVRRSSAGLIFCS